MGASKHVSIDNEAIDEFCAEFTMNHVMHWLEEAPFNISDLSDDERLAFLFVFNSISFCYWGSPKWTIEYDSKQFDGAWAMIACIGRAYSEGKPIFDPRYLQSITDVDLQDILRGNVTIPLFDQRLHFLQALGKIIVNQFQGSFGSVVETANKDAELLLQLLIEKFPFFDDQAKYLGSPVYFYKRAQLLIADIWQGFGSQGYGELHNTQMLTACADYKLPQVLRNLGILKYDSELISKLDNRIELAQGCPEETEIRSNTIWAVEKMKDKLNLAIPDIHAIHINDRLWLLSQIKSIDDKPYHLVRTSSY